MQKPKSTPPFLIILLSFAAIPAVAQFVDRSAAAGINNTGQNRGVAIADYDGDGREDIYFTRLDGPNHLYRNNSNGTFTDVAAAAGLDYAGPSGTAVWGDLDNDGRPDLVLGNRNQGSRLYRNLGNGSFEDITFSSGVSVSAQVMSVNLADVDLDGHLDIYFANLGTQNALYRNNGDGTFSDYTYASGALDERIAMGAVFFDYDLDGDPDLYLVHDGNQPNILYQNNGKGVFTDVSRAAGVDLAAQGMGVDVADADGDGWLDIYITNLYENVLFRNLGNGTFEDISRPAGVTDRGMGWGTAFFDYDNDSRPDIYVANETYFAVDYQYYNNILYRNLGALSFSAVTDDEALSSPYGGYGVATADLDHDGRCDLLIANSGQGGNQLLFNRQDNTHHWIVISLEGSTGNRSAIGARVVLEVGDQVLTDEVIAGSGFAGQNSLSLHFGLGMAELVDRLQIYWPGGGLETFEQLEADRRLHFVESAGMVTAAKEPFMDEEGELRISPNPTSGAFSLQLNFLHTVDYCRYSIYNSHGQLMWQEDEEFPLSGKLYKRLNMIENAAPGLYYLQVCAGGRCWTGKLIFSRR